MFGEPSGTATNFQMKVAAPEPYVRADPFCYSPQTLDIDIFAVPRADVLVMIGAQVGNVRIPIHKSTLPANDDHLCRADLRSKKRREERLSVERPANHARGEEGFHRDATARKP